MGVRKLMIMMLAVAAVFAVVFGALVLMSSGGSECKVADGSVLRVEKAVYGKRVPYRPPLGWKERLANQFGPYLPKKWTASLTQGTTGGAGSWYQLSLVHSNSDALHLWVTRRDAVSGAFQNVGIDYGEITDSHGCVFRSTQCGGDNFLPGSSQPQSARFSGPQSSVVWLTFEGFPRHERSFKLRLYNWGADSLGELTVANPAPAPKEAAWVGGSLPVVNTQGGLSFLLTKAVLKTNYTTRKTNGSYYGLPVEVVPSFEVLENGVRTRDWEALDLELWDGSGNFASRVYSSPTSAFLCPRERLWKLGVRFYGRENAPGASNAVWRISGVKVPSAGGFTLLDAQSAPAGFPVRPVALGGSGEVIYSNGIPIAASAPENFTNNYNSVDRTGWGKTAVQKVRNSSIQLAVFMMDLKDSQRLTVRARDDQGRDTFAEQWRYGGLRTNQPSAEVHFISNTERQDPAFLSLDLWPDAKTVELTFCVHEPRLVEFVFKPPGK